MKRMIMGAALLALSIALGMVNVVRRGGSSETASVAFSTQNLTSLAGVAGVDYQPTNGVLTFAPQETSKSFAVPLIDNLAANPERRIGLSLKELAAVIEEPAQTDAGRGRGHKGRKRRGGDDYDDEE